MNDTDLRRLARRALGKVTADDQHYYLSKRLIAFYEKEPPDTQRYRRVTEIMAGAKLRSQGYESDVTHMSDNQLYGVLQRGIDALPDDQRAEFTRLIEVAP